MNCYRCNKPIKFDRGALCEACQNKTIKCIDCNKTITDYDNHVYRDYKRCVSCDQKHVDVEYARQELASENPNFDNLLAMDFNGSEF